MGRKRKIRICTETERRKAELINNIDEKIVNPQSWEEALSNLQYLFRNAPGIRALVKQKLALLYFEMKDYQKSIIYLQDLIPTTDRLINEMVISCLICLGKLEYAIWHLAKSPLTTDGKRGIFENLSLEPKIKTQQESVRGTYSDRSFSLRCPSCTRFLFYFYNENRYECLFCK
ncbi:MAG: hypothetical protein ACW97X_08370 [Candidatus Hodarchaeales archaeon]